jgi:DNA-binding MarR family transcriptional regulator
VDKSSLQHERLWKMKEDNLELAITNLFSLFPLFQKKLMKPDHCVDQIELSPSHFQIIFILKEFGILPVSEIGKKLMISRPNMTPLIDKLISEGLVKRVPSEEDRRIIYIDFTDKGRRFLEDHQKMMMNNLKIQLSGLSDEDLVQLATAFANIRNVFLKID